MTAINLLPWREKERERKNKVFSIICGICLLLAALLVFAGVQYYANLTDHQRQRNQFLQKQIAIMNAQLDEINTLEEKKARLLERMNVVQNLQSERPQTVHLLQELATAAPEGIHLKALKQTEKSISLQGTTDSNARVSTYMRRLNDSPWLAKPRLELIDAESGNKSSAFTLHIEQTVPDTESEAAAL